MFPMKTLSTSYLEAIRSFHGDKRRTGMGEVKGGLTLPWLWVALIVAFLALGFMLPPLDKPLRELAKQAQEIKASMQEGVNQ